MESTALPHALTSLLAELPEDIGWNIFVLRWARVADGFVVCFGLARRGITQRVFVGVPALVMEHVVLFIESVCVGVIGPHGRKYEPLIVALWAYVFEGNLFGLVFNFTPTPNGASTFRLAVITIVFRAVGGGPR